MSLLRPIVNEMSVQCAVILERGSQGVGVVADLACGDVIEIAEGIVTREGRNLRFHAMTLCVGGIEVPVRGHANIVELLGPARLRVNTMANESERVGTVVREGLLSAMTIDVEIIVARATATVAQIASWTIGDRVALGDPLGSVVTVRAGERDLARGVLCEVDGRLGVQLTEML